MKPDFQEYGPKLPHPRSQIEDIPTEHVNKKLNIDTAARGNHSSTPELLEKLLPCSPVPGQPGRFIK